ncbi:MAG: hypothetical protein E7596_04050 [Ruminococcaceae bacterium]|nr:hypothetical protein [Oscillospiraceae bacterium]
MKKLLLVISLALALCAVLGITALAAEEEKTPNELPSTCIGCEVCNPTSEEVNGEMPPMKVQINGEAFVDSLVLMGKGMVGIFVVTLVIIGVVAILNWHGKTLDDRKNKNQ